MELNFDSQVDILPCGPHIQNLDGGDAVSILMVKIPWFMA